MEFLFLSALQSNGTGLGNKSQQNFHWKVTCYDRVTAKCKGHKTREIQQIRRNRCWWHLRRAISEKNCEKDSM